MKNETNGIKVPCDFFFLNYPLNYEKFYFMNVGYLVIWRMFDQLHYLKLVWLCLFNKDWRIQCTNNVFIDWIVTSCGNTNTIQHHISTEYNYTCISIQILRISLFFGRVGSLYDACLKSVICFDNINIRVMF